MLDTAQAYGLDFLYPAGDDTIGRSLRLYGEFARPEIDLLVDYATSPTGMLIDVGANIGAISLPFAKANPEWKVLAIEAHRGLCNVLAANTLNNRLYNVEPFHAAAGSERRFVDFSAAPLTLSANYGTMSVERVTGRREPIRMFPLDDLAPSAALIKIDVEGFEPEVLKGAGRILMEKRAIWLVEAGEKTPAESRAVARAFIEAGYRLFWFFAPFATPSSTRGRPESPTMGDANVLALPPGVENLWGLPELTSPDAPRPKSLGDYPYLARYGY